MQCRTHPDRNGVNTCNQCGEWLCDGCTVEINGRIFCRHCLAQLAGEPDAPAPVPAAAYAPRPAARRFISWGVLFLFSVIVPVPGLNYMYEGLIKRGLAAMSGFFLLIYMTAVFGSSWNLNLIFLLAIPVLVLACIFDGFRIRHLMNAGVEVRDDIDDIVGFLRRNKTLIICFVVLIAVLALAGSLFSAFPFSIRRLLPIVVVGVGLYMLVRSPRKGEHRRHGHHGPYHGHHGDGHANQ